MNYRGPGEWGSSTPRTTVHVYTYTLKKLFILLSAFTKNNSLFEESLIIIF